MRTVGIIAEYNPFHTGHEYHIQKARELTNADYVIVVMSPDFVQRGEPAVFDKYTRAQMALQCGADLVIELPVCYATGSAEYFAEGAVAMLNAFGMVDVLCFGGESDDVRLFQYTANILNDEPAVYQETLSQLLKQGKTYPQARSQALISYLQNSTNTSYPTDVFADFLSTPNNILGIEYCKALHKLKSSITPLPLLRQGNGYNSSSLTGAFCSATAIRNSIMQSLPGNSAAASYIPDNCKEVFADAVQKPLHTKDFLPYIYQKFLSSEDFTSILDVSSDLSDRIKSSRYKCIGKSYEDMVALLKTKQMTESRIRRALLHTILDIEETSVQSFRLEGPVFYARILGFRKSASSLLHQIKLQTQIPLIVKTASAEKTLSETALTMWKQDLYASHLYRSVHVSTYGSPFKTEYEHSPIII